MWSLTRILVVGRDLAKCAVFIDRLRTKGLDAESAAPETARRAADITVTATTARASLFAVEWVRHGTHISSMGSDATGKQELPPELFAQSTPLR